MGSMEFHIQSYIYINISDNQAMISDCEEFMEGFEFNLIIYKDFIVFCEHPD